MISRRISNYFDECGHSHPAEVEYFVGDPKCKFRFPSTLPGLKGGANGAQDNCRTGRKELYLIIYFQESARISLHWQ